MKPIPFAEAFNQCPLSCYISTFKKKWRFFGTKNQACTKVSSKMHATITTKLLGPCVTTSQQTSLKSLLFAATKYDEKGIILLVR